MSRDRRVLAQQAVAEAMKTRRKQKVPLQVPLCIFDFAECFGVAVRFAAIPSMEGIYLADARPKPTILVSSLRPAGRRAMTCGHELGHHVFGHGAQWDELMDERNQSRRFEPQEFLVDVFSASLQMPKLAVSHQAAIRSIDLQSCAPERVYALSTLFGVSYGGFVTHLEKSLDLIDMQRASDLAKCPPKDLRASLLGSACPQNLTVVDLRWKDKPIDVEIGDTVLLPPDVAVEGRNLDVVDVDGDRTLLSARKSGYCRVTHPSGWASHVRISRKDYEGLARVRFFEECNDDE